LFATNEATKPVTFAKSFRATITTTLLPTNADTYSTAIKVTLISPSADQQ